MGCYNCKKSQEFEECHEETNTVVQEIQEYLVPDPPPIPEPELRPPTALAQEETSSNDLVLQGELFKVQSGMKNKQISRWVQLYEQDIRYYKNEYSAAFWWNKPLGIISIESIAGLSNDANDACYQFEIILKKPSSGSNNKNAKKSGKINAKNPAKVVDCMRYIFNAKTREETDLWKKAILDLINKRA